MRTTILIDPFLEPKLKGMGPKRKLSRFVNLCLREHFEKDEKTRRMASLEKAYGRAAKRAVVARDFEMIDPEGWPEW